MRPHAWPLTVNPPHSPRKSNTALSCSAHLPSRFVTWAASQPDGPAAGSKAEDMGGLGPPHAGGGIKLHNCSGRLF